MCFGFSHFNNFIAVFIGLSLQSLHSLNFSIIRHKIAPRQFFSQCINKLALKRLFASQGAAFLPEVKFRSSVGHFCELYISCRTLAAQSMCFLRCPLCQIRTCPASSPASVCAITCCCQEPLASYMACSLDSGSVTCSGCHSCWGVCICTFSCVKGKGKCVTV